MLRGIRPAGGGALVATVSPSAISARFDVSRAHVRKLLGVGRAHGWLSVTANGDQIFFEAGFHGRLRQWIALEFAWARRLVATNPVLCEGMA
jgi:DNA-binding transcriptional regulator LsrR (DeoR family)